MTLQPTYQYPEPEIPITRAEYRLLQQLYRNILQERLAADTLGPAEAIAAIRRTDQTIAKITAHYRG